MRTITKGPESFRRERLRRVAMQKNVNIEASGDKITSPHSATGAVYCRETGRKRYGKSVTTIITDEVNNKESQRPWERESQRQKGSGTRAAPDSGDEEHVKQRMQPDNKRGQNDSLIH